MKRKEPKQTSPVQLKKNRSSIGEVGSPTPASSMEEQKRRAKEWYENEEKKKGESTSAKSTAKPKSKTPTTKTPSKKEKAEVEEEPIAPRSTRKTTRATSETPSKNRTLSAKVEVEFINDDEEESEEEEEVVAPAPKVRKTSSAKITKEVKEVKEEPAAAVKTPRTRKAAPAKVPTPILSPEPESPPVLTKAQILEEERRRAREWYEEQERNKIVSPSSSAPKSASKTPVAPKSATKSATKPAKSTTTTPNKAAATPVGHPPTTGASGAQCPFAFAAEGEREIVPETFNPNAHNANVAPANDCHQTLAVSVALAAVPLGAIAYYDPKIAVTTLVILFVVSVVRRIFAMIADAEKNI